MAVLKKAWMARRGRTVGGQHKAAAGPPGQCSRPCGVFLASCAQSNWPVAPVDAARAAINSDEAGKPVPLAGTVAGNFLFCHRHVGFGANRQLSEVKN